MEGSITKSYKFGTFITSDILIELNKFITGEYSFVKYSIHTFDGAVYKIEDFNQILEYDNQGYRRLKIINIMGCKDRGSDVSFINPDITLSLRDASEYNTSVEYTIRKATQKEIIYLTSKIDEVVLNFKSNYSWMHTLSARLMFPFLFYIPAVYFIIKNMDKITDKTYFMIMLISYSFIGTMMLSWIYEKILLMFPKTVFYIGKQIQLHDKIKKRKNYFIYGIIFTFILSVLASVTANYIGK